MNIYFTFDYELFLGKNTGTIDNCLFIPMNNVIKIFNKYHIKSTIFVDASYLLRLNELSDKHAVLQNDLNRIKEHIRAMHEDGHDIQLHFHPQWFYSYWDNGKWEIDTKHYKLSDMEGKTALEKLRDANTFLENIINKKLTAFRAGGYSLTTYNNYTELFNAIGIKIDSSVLRNSVYKSVWQSYDYRNIPSETIYNFSSDVCFEDDNGSFSELSITTKSYNGLFSFLTNKYYRIKYNPHIYGDGIGIGYPGQFYNKFLIRIKRLLSKKVIPASLDMSLILFLPDIYNSLRNTGQTDMVIISHPKYLSEITFDLMENFLEKTTLNCKFLTAGDIDMAAAGYGKLKDIRI